MNGLRAIKFLLFTALIITCLLFYATSCHASENERENGEDSYYTMAFPDLVTAPANAHIHTHVCVVGEVGSIRHEKDDDYHIKLCQGAAGSMCLILEIIPEVPMVRPHKGQRIQACGIVRFDGWHQFWELHPLLTWKPL